MVEDFILKEMSLNPFLKNAFFYACIILLTIRMIRGPINAASRVVVQLAAGEIFVEQIVNVQEMLEKICQLKEVVSISHRITLSQMEKDDILLARVYIELAQIDDSHEYLTAARKNIKEYFSKRKEQKRDWSSDIIAIIICMALYCAFSGYSLALEGIPWLELFQDAGTWWSLFVGAVLWLILSFAGVFIAGFIMQIAGRYLDPGQKLMRMN